MCVIVHQQPGQSLVKRDVLDLWKQNPDGGGIAYPYNGRIVTFKTLKFSEFWRKYRSVIKKHPETDVMLHMRIATHGEVGLANTHPFKVSDDMIMAHNGIIWDCVPARWDNRSDTRVFVEEALPNLPEGWLDNVYLNAMVEAFVDSRLMFLSVDPNLRQTVYRLGRWETYKGIKMSNTIGLGPKPLLRSVGRTSTGKMSWDHWPNTHALPVGQPDEDDSIYNEDGWVKAPSDDDEYEMWINEMIREYELKEDLLNENA